ncbi:hypothetical protein ACOI1H_21000 [Loktanella sp. DJP18]|uniref:hypothetical protein n=1 Tax=Loktanella sp. DJP18 TaxID=3409788 RepID=UPI003BB7BED4
MSSAEPILGADLYIKAVEAGLPKLCKEGGENSSVDDYANLGMATKQMARFLFLNGLVENDENKNPVRNDTNIRGLTAAQQADFLPLYDSAVRENQNAAPLLIGEGKQSYVDYVRQTHIGKDFELVETVIRVRDEDMQAVVSASLNLLDAVQKEPAHAAFVKGLDGASTDALWNVLEQANYLMPGENKDRKAPIGEQSLRGTPEEREAVIFQASAIVANLDLPENINAADRPTTYAFLLRNAVQSAQTEEIEVTGLNASPDMNFDSDLMREDANSLFNFLGAANRMMQAANYDPSRIDHIVVPAHLAEATSFWLDDCIEKNIPEALGSGNFEAPGIDSKFGVRMADMMKWAKEAFDNDAELTNYTGDDGGELTQEGKMQDEAWGLDNAFDSTGDSDGEEAGQDTEELIEDNSGDRFVGSNKMASLNESMSSIVDQISSEALEGGAMDKLRQHAGRAQSEMSDLQSSAAAFNSIEDAMGADRVATTPEISNRLSETMSVAAWNSMNPARRKSLRVALVQSGQGPFRDYKDASADSASKKMTRFIDDNMLLTDEHGKTRPNLQMRNFLRDASQMPVVANTKAEAEAVRAYAERFVAREAEEHRLRHENDEKTRLSKRDLMSIEFSAEDALRMVRVAEASGNNAPALMTLSKDGFATLSHPDAPQLRSPMDKMTPEIEKSDRSPRKLGGHIQIEQLKAAVQTGAEKIIVQVHGETPVGVIGKLNEVEAPAKTKTKRYDDVVLS